MELVLNTEFGFHDKVIVDDEPSIQCNVNAFLLRSPGYIQAEVSWWSNGSLNSQWVDVTRLKKVER